MSVVATLLPSTVRGRLWTALAMLSTAVIVVSGLTWLALQRVDARLQELHRQSLTRVAEAIDLSKRSSDLVASAPFLLTQRSNYLIEQEGGLLLAVLEEVRADWPGTPTEETNHPDSSVAAITLRMEAGIRDLMAAAANLETLQADLRRQVARLGTLRETTTRATEAATDDAEKLTWWALKNMNADVLNAAYANNLIGVGEEQRYFQRQRNLLIPDDLSPAQSDFVAELDGIATGPLGLFELRRQELALQLQAQNALFRIRREANGINAAASSFAARAEAVLTGERSASSTMIQITRISVAAISIASLALALLAALFVSRYVASNISRVSEAMVRLANGDRTAALPRHLGQDDEIGDLFRSYRFFRANALRLDRTNRKLDQRNTLFEKVFANISDGVAITDAAGQVTARNPAFNRIFETVAERSLGVPLVDLLVSDRFVSNFNPEDLFLDAHGFAELRATDGQILELRASPPLPDGGYVCLISDVTERRKLAERVEQIDRIETLGKVAGDTAHDFANVLSTIRTHAHLLSKSTPAPLDAHVGAIENAVDFGASLSERLLAFSRKQRLAPEIVELNRLVSGLIDLAEIGLKDNVALEVELADAPVEVLADPGQLESALLNLILNANNSISDKGTIKVRLVRNTDEDVHIIVSDDGCGMSPEVKMRAIEPFFTTRATDGGTGLGLSIVYGFIKQSGGNLEIESEPGRFTTITLALPITNAHVDSAMSQRSGRALVVDDNSADETFAVGLCEALGFETESCGSLAEAKAKVEAQHYELILSDLDLNGPDEGLQLFHWSRRLSPDTRFILMSGRSNSRDTMLNDVDFIGKPLSAASLGRVLKIDLHN